MSEGGASIFDTGLPRTRANHRPLTPLDFLAWSASVVPGAHRRRLRRAGASPGARSTAAAAGSPARLRGLGVGRGDTVAVLCPNTPPMLEAHYGVPMAGAVLNALNTRLDPASIAFILEHGEAKVLLADTEWAPVVKAALAQVQRRPAVIDIVDPAAPGERLGDLDYEALLAPGDPAFAWEPPGRRVGRDLALLHLGHHRQPQGRGLPPSRRLPERAWATRWCSG